jgi:hypothetical protein
MSNLPWIRLAALTALLAPTVAHPSLIGFPACTGPTNCQLTSTPPDRVTKDPNDGTLLAWNEVQNLTLTQDLRVDRVADPTEPFIASDGRGGFLILAGTVVSSHYLQ